MNYGYFVLGISGTGKSTRLYALKKFLEVKGFSFVPFSDEQHCYGTRCKEFNLVFLGKEVTRNGITTWQGVDILTSKFETSENMFNKFFSWIKDHNLVMEGASTLLTFRNRPIDLHAKCPEARWRSFWYVFSSFEEYQRRILSRSNKEIKSEAMWSKNATVLNNVTKHAEELRLTPGFDFPGYKNSYDSPMSSFGEKVLEDLQPDLVAEFKNFCENEFVYLRDIGSSKVLMSEDLF